jgi:hypothetical protein
MKPNAFQKILALIYLVLIAVCCIFYVPFRETHGKYKTEIIYDAIWSGNSNFDLYRIGIYLVLLSVSFYFIYRYLNRMNDLDEAVYKTKARFELISYIVFISAIAICFLFLVVSNGINQYRKKSLTEDIKRKQGTITEKSAKWEAKKANRRNFWDESRSTFNLDNFDNDIQKYWEALMKLKENNISLTSFYGEFSIYSLKRFNFKNPNDLKHFIETNAYDNDDVAKQEEVKLLNAELNPVIAKRDSITFYQDTEIRKIMLICLAILFGLLYILRPLFAFIKGIFAELK